MYCMENNKICPMLSIFTITSGIPRLNRSGVNALGRKLIRVRLKNMGGNVSQIPFLMMSVVVIFTIESICRLEEYYEKPVRSIQKLMLNR